MNTRKIRLIVLGTLHLLLCSQIASAGIVQDSQFEVNLYTDKYKYSPGERLKIYMNVTNRGNETVLGKQVQIAVTAKSWFNIIGHKEVRDWNRRLAPGQSGYGYVEAPIPWYTPLGIYEIKAWVIYGDKDSDINVITLEDRESIYSSVQIEVDIGWIFLLAVLAILVSASYVIAHLKRKRAAPIPVEAKRVEEKEVAIDVDKAIALSMVLAISLTLVWVGYVKKEKEEYSVLYIVPGSYTKYPTENTVSFTYGIESHEGVPTKYELLIYVGNGSDYKQELLDKKEFYLGESGPVQINKIEATQTITIPPHRELPIVVELILKAREKEYENHFWLRKPESNITEGS